MSGVALDQHNRVIVIGASAGGVRALLQLLPRLTPNIPAAILIVLHIGAHRSHLAELITAKGPNRAVFAQSGQALEAGTIYIAPPDQHLLLESGGLRLFRGPKEHHARPAINPLFRSAALELGVRAVGVILTGMLDDGAAGLHAIKACGGTTIVQDPDEATEPSMPLNALAVTPADYIVRLDDMADLLNNLAISKSSEPTDAPHWLRAEHAISLGSEGMQALAKIGHPSGYTCPDCGGALFELRDGKPVRFLCHTGHAFSLLSLASAQALVTDEALWAALRVVQEKEAILRHLADASSARTVDQQAALEEADSLAVFADHLRAVILNAPSADLAEELDKAIQV